jgi:hypothetical protein
MSRSLALAVFPTSLPMDHLPSEPTMSVNCWDVIGATLPHANDRIGKIR